MENQKYKILDPSRELPAAEFIDPFLEEINSAPNSVFNQLRSQAIFNPKNTIPEEEQKDSRSMSQNNESNKKNQINESEEKSIASDSNKVLKKSQSSPNIFSREKPLSQRASNSIAPQFEYPEFYNFFDCSRKSLRYFSVLEMMIMIDTINDYDKHHGSEGPEAAQYDFPKKMVLNAFENKFERTHSSIVVKYYNFLNKLTNAQIKLLRKFANDPNYDPNEYSIENRKEEGETLFFFKISPIILFERELDNPSFKLDLSKVFFLFIKGRFNIKNRRK